MSKESKICNLKKNIEAVDAKIRKLEFQREIYQRQLDEHLDAIERQSEEQ